MVKKGFRFGKAIWILLKSAPCLVTVALVALPARQGRRQTTTPSERMTGVKKKLNLSYGIYTFYGVSN